MRAPRSALGAAAPAAGAPNKHGAIKTVVDGIRFDSRLEARRYSELKRLEAAGEIECLVLQPKFEIVPAVVLGGRRVPARKYIADFGYVECATGEVVVEDVKGRRLPMYMLKRHLMRHVHDIEIRETR